MFNDFAGFIIFVMVTSFTPGPNNLSALSSSLNVGYRRTLPYIIGIICGVFLVQIAMATALLTISSSAISEWVAYLRYFGAACILYIAIKCLKMNFEEAETSEVTSTAPRFIDGFLFQAVNPKVYFFTLTIYTTFIDYSRAHFAWLVVLCLAMAALTFVSVSTWGVAGNLAGKYMRSRRARIIFTSVVVIALIFTAYRIVII